MKRPFEVIYEDNHILVVNKHPGVLSIPDRYHPEKTNLLSELRSEYREVFVLHRLDKDTSGILVFARNEEAHKDLSLQFEERTVRKYYFAIVDGQLQQDHGVIVKPIAPSPYHRDQMMITASGKASKTSFQVIDRFKAFTSLEVEIHTGRTHQIRVHFQSIGHPLAVDSTYGKRDQLLLSEFKKKNFSIGKNKEERPLISRSTLHAHKIQFNHPATGKLMAFEAPLPKDLRATVNQLQKWAV